MSLRFHTLDVFTESAFGGNPLAVVLDADGLGDAQMQRIAREFNLSETVFVCRPQAAAHAASVRIFTPARELPFAGHPTVGAACLLVELGLSGARGVATAAGEELCFVLGERVGPVPVKVVRAPGRAPFAQLTAAQRPAYGAPLPPPAALARALGLREADIASDPGPRTASCGVPFALVPLRSPELLAGIDFDVAACRAAFGGPAPGLWVYAPAHERDFRARMFAPDLGVHEDPATGSAACAFAGALALESPQRDGTLAWSIEQGLEMGRPSLLLTEADKRDGAVTAVRVGGHAVRITDGTLRLP